MMKYYDEKDLQRKICKVLNRYGYSFKKGKDNYFCDVYDPLIKAYCEVKVGGKFAPQQLIYGLVRENIQDAKYLALANEYEIRFYKTPDWNAMSNFAHRISKDLSKSPSKVTSKKQMVEAFNILGDHYLIYNYVGDFKLFRKQPYIFLNDANYEYFQEILTKYNIDPAKFINTFTQTYTNNSTIYLKNDKQTLFDVESGKSVKAGRKITNPFDVQLITNMRIKADDIDKIIHKIDTLTALYKRRKRGKYWSGGDVAEITGELVRKYVDADVYFEPFVGGGSLIRQFVHDGKQCVINDIDGSSVDLLIQEFEGYNVTAYKYDLFKTPIDDVVIPDGSLCIYTNPPFGTSSTSKLASKKSEVKNMAKKSTKSRKNHISYGATPQEAKYIGDTYGRGDLVLSALGHMIEYIRRRGSGYLCFFSPFGVMLGRKRYAKTLKILKNEFEFLYGEVFPGSAFNGVSKNVSISFTIWKYGGSTDKMTFKYGDKVYETHTLPLLKDGWNYDTRKYIRGEIAIQVNAYISYPTPKIFHMQIKKGGSEVVPENVKKPLNIPNVPDELAYALWSTVVGKSSATKYPILFNDAYTHLPDFKNEKTMEILAYAVMYNLLREIAGNYTDGRIGFIGMSRVFKFGNEKLTKGALYLINTYGDCPVGESTIKESFDALREGEEVSRVEIKEQIQKRLEEIGYWDYLPIPEGI